MACAKCSLYTPKSSTGALRLEGKRMRQIPLLEGEALRQSMTGSARSMSC
jgi:hypothetical protein